MFILKPVNKCQGKNIRILTSKPDDIAPENRKKYLISHYIKFPHLINNLKYDLRLYVLVSCYNPLRIYLYNDGLVRFATETYDLKSDNVTNKFMHLTNFSVNKLSDKFMKNNSQDNIAQGSKWSLKALKE